MTMLRNLMSVAFLILLTACTSVDQSMRSANAIGTLLPSEQVKIAGNSAVTVNCLDNMAKFSKSGDGPCIYQMVAVKPIYDEFAVTGVWDRASRRNAYVSFLMNIADQNCEAFLNRTYAGKAVADISKSTTSDIFTGLTAATASASAPAAVSLGMANLVVGKTVDNVNATFFLDKSFQALQSAIYLERSAVRTSIDQSRYDAQGAAASYDRYTIYDALSDLGRYSAACSFRSGVGRLAQIAGNEEAAQKASDAVGKTKATPLTEIATKVAGYISNKSPSEPVQADLRAKLAELTGLRSHRDILLEQLKNTALDRVEVMSAALSKAQVDITSKIAQIEVLLEPSSN